MSRRTDRVNEQLRVEISTLLAREIKDPRLNGIISVTRVESSGDLRSARAYISVMGNAEAKKAALAGIQSAASFLRREMRDRINMRHTPFITYLLDDSILEADHVIQAMNKVRAADSGPDSLRSDEADGENPDARNSGVVDGS
ncbi:MAG: 30S ribosome-binding factor RbfA [Chloroflexi bacterium]|nr:30S ribosome-binding factor RbfA [Chloroflexota bacterium]MDA1272251.1 30S ribosome-binding factor RbfA [Chloroflexota bacterium]